MSLPNSHLAFFAEYDTLDRAIEKSYGIRVNANSQKAAQTLRARIHHARAVDRKRNRELYKPGDPLYDCSIYDTLVVTIEPEGEIYWVYIRKNQILRNTVEDLGEEDVVQYLEHAPLVPQITYENKEPQVEDKEPIIDDFPPEDSPPTIRRRF